MSPDSNVDSVLLALEEALREISGGKMIAALSRVWHAAQHREEISGTGYWEAANMLANSDRFRLKDVDGTMTLFQLARS